MQLTEVLIVVGVFIKFTVQALNDQLSERFTDHQRVCRASNFAIKTELDREPIFSFICSQAFRYWRK